MTTSAARKGTPVVRRATQADLPACAAIVNSYIDATEWLPRVRSHEAIAADFAPDLLERRTVFVVEKDGVVAGYMTMTPEGMVPALYLAPDLRGMGIGRQLLDRAKALSPAGVELTVFAANSAALRFYEREGFVEVPEGRRDDTGEGVPVLLMRWRPAKSAGRTPAREPSREARP